jgi:hypothetical protein
VNDDGIDAVSTRKANPITNIQDTVVINPLRLGLLRNEIETV